MPAATDQDLKRPNRPEGDECDKAVVGAHHPTPLLLFQSNIVTEKARVPLFEIEALRRQLACRGLRNGCGSPYLAMRRSEEHTSELQSHSDLVCRLLLEKKKKKNNTY